MNTLEIKYIKENFGNKISISGWILKKTDLGGLMFLYVRDGSGAIQCVCEKSSFSSLIYSKIKQIKKESFIKISGIVRADKRAFNSVEISANGFEVINECFEEFPIYLNSKPSHCMKFRHLDLRNKTNKAIMKIRDSVIFATRTFLKINEFICVDSPILTPTACEDPTGLFRVDYFEDTAYLSQSGQLHAEVAALAYGKAYCFSPAFRAENRDSKRHLTEFWMVEPEMINISLEDNIEFQQKMIAYVIEYLIDNNLAELDFFGVDIKKYLNRFPVLKYDEAIKLLNKKGIAINYGSKLSHKNEMFLSKYLKGPFYLTHHPIKQKSFYMKPEDENPDIALSCDLISDLGYGELIGGGIRVDDYDELENNIINYGLPKKAFQWYLDLRKFGSAPHGGFGMGIERFISWICQLNSIQESIPFPRIRKKIIN